MSDKPQRPTWKEMLDLLRDAPPRVAIQDQRYWDWRGKVDELLARAPEVG